MKGTFRTLGIKLIRMRISNISNGLQPVIDDAVTMTIQRRSDAATAVVATQDDVLDSKCVDGEFQHREQIQISSVHQIGNVSVNEYFTRLESGNHVGWNPAIRTANPQIFRLLNGNQTLKVFRIVL